MRDLYNTGLTQETSPGPCRLYGSHPATRARSYRSGLYLPCLADLDHEAGIDYLSEVLNVVKGLSLGVG